MEHRTTADGSTTLYSDEFGETFHSSSGARTEAREKFALPLLASFPDTLPDPFRILDIGFGPGYNTLETVRALRNTRPDCSIRISALEADPEPVQECATIHSGETDSALASLVRAAAMSVETDAEVLPRLFFRLHIGDARQSAQEIEPGYHAVLLDGFSTRRNPELWTVDFFRELYRLLDNQGILLTYSSAYPVVSGLEEAGFIVGTTPPVGRENGGTAAWKEGELPFSPRPAGQEKERCETTGRLPFRDPGLTGSRESILNTYEQERQSLVSDGVPSIRQYRKKSSLS